MNPDAPVQNARVGGGRMRMGAHAKADAAVDEMAERLLLAGRLGVKVDDRGVAARSQRTGREFVFDSRERIVERIHEDAAHHVHDQHFPAVGRLYQIRASPGRALGVVGGADQPRLALDEDQRFLLVEGVVAQRDRIGPRGEEIPADRLGDAESARCVLAVDDHEIELPTRPQVRQMLQQHGASRPPHDVADEQEAHQRMSRASISSLSVRMKSSRWSCGSFGTASTSQTE